ncbi:MAG: dienelactone hydrolase family protein [Pseudomonadota bacterium]
MHARARFARASGAAFFTIVLGIGSGYAQQAVTSEGVSFEAATARDGGVTVRGELRIPPSAQPRLPAVLVLHTAAGYEHDQPIRTGPYVEALNRAGIATLWIEMFPNWQSLPRTTREVMPHTYGSLLYLAAHPRIDPQRIGVVGFSYGGVLAVIMTSQEVTQEYTGGKARFAAHLAFYPICWIQQQIRAGSNRVYGAGTYAKLTGAPAHILTGEKDDYEEPDTCPKFVASLSENDRKQFGATVYPGAYHAFDNPHAVQSYQDRLAFLGRGGTVTNKFDAATAAKSLAFAEEFFAKHLGLKK